MDYTFALGSPYPNLSSAVSPAWVHLRRLCCRKYSLTQYGIGDLLWLAPGKVAAQLSAAADPVRHVTFREFIAD
jgi:hypothetical protein